MLELSPQLKYYYDKSLESFQRSHFDYSIEMLKAVIRQAPHYVPAYRLLYQSALGLDRSGNKSLFNRLSGQIKTFYFQFLSSLNLLRKNIDRAQWSFVQGLLEQPQNRNLLKGWLRLSMKEGWLDTAIIPAEALCEINPKQVEGYLLLSNLYVQKGTVDNAKSIIQKGLRILPTDPQLTRRLKEIEAERTMQRGDWGGKS